MFRWHRLLPLMASLLLVGYVVLLLALTSVGQQRLRESTAAQQRYELEKMASAFAYFFDERRRDVERLGEDRALDSFFSNVALGMSMEYGLRASLRNLERSIQRVVDKASIHGWPVFERIVLLDGAGGTLVDTRPQEPAVTPRLSDADAAAKTSSIVVERTGDAATVGLHARYEHKGRPAGYIVALIDHDTAFRELVRNEREPGDAVVAMLDQEGRVLVGAEPHSTSTPPLPGIAAAAERLYTHEHTVVRVPIPGTPFELASQRSVTGATDYLTSPWLTVSLSVLALLVLAGAAVVQRTRTQNLLLQAKIEEGKRQEQTLSEQNQRLEHEMHVRLHYEQKLLHQANYDQLTALPNRTLAVDRLEQAMARGERSGSQTVVFYLDLDRFKNVNDTLGHQAGDQLLLQAARRLGDVARSNDTVARLSGDEFLIVMADIEPGSSAEKSAERVAETILRRFSEPFTVAGQEFFVSVSIGIAVFPDDGNRAERLLQHADTALYQAKEEGRDTFRFFTPEMNRRAQRRATVEGHLLHAIERKELSVVYQPIVSLRTGAPLAFEALVRWQCAALGPVPPTVFIPLAEETGLIQDIGEWVLDRAVADLAAWGADPALRLAVNVSSRQLRSSQRFLGAIESTLTRHGVAPTQLELEITERLLLADLPDTTRALQELDRLGVRLSIDDFGTGYSSLGYVKRFPVDVLKIDRSFVSGILHNEDDAALVRAILALASALRVDVVAEGIESEAQAEFLHENGCRCGQGFWFSVPMPSESVPAFLAHASAVQRRRSA
ncbi:MAG: EAL domain-containing protein [Gammaproteobacteria bacterium]|jgi:diguanylate cyclase (GGDEF)-like protein|nr:EAL domain-containing protein [Gammaproteobacteria bacterium]